MTHAVEARHLHRAYADALAPGSAPQNVLDADALENRRARYAQVVAIATFELDRLHAQIRGSGYALVLTDADGAVLYEKQDASLLNKPLERMRSGVAIRGVGREVIAVLDAACGGATATRASHLHMVALISACAHLIEKCLFLRHHQHHVVLRFHARPELVDLAHDGAIALAIDGTVIGADRVAEQLLGADDRYQLLGRPIADIFDAEGEDFVKRALAHCTTLWALREMRRGHRYYTSVHGAARALAPTAAATFPARPAV